MPPFFCWDLGSYLLLSLSQVDCLSPLHLVVFVSFYFAPLSETYFFVISFCQTFWVRGLLSTGCKILVPLAYRVCPLVGEVSPEACAVIPLIGCLVLCWSEPALAIERDLTFALCLLLRGQGQDLLPSFCSWGPQICYLAEILVCTVRWDWSTPTWRSATEFSSIGAVHLWLCSIVSSLAHCVGS